MLTLADHHLLLLPEALTTTEASAFVAAAEAIGFQHQGSRGAAYGEAYRKGQRFGRHIDDSNELPGGRFTGYTLLIYLSACGGGETVFYGPRNRRIAAVAPRAGLALLHLHGEEDCLDHEGAAVTEGVKYVLRSDVVFQRRYSFCLKNKLYQCPPKTWCYMPRSAPEAPSSHNPYGPCVPDHTTAGVCPLAGSALAAYVTSDRHHPLKAPPAPPNDAAVGMYILFRHKPHWWPDSVPWTDELGKLERQKAKEREARQRARERAREQQRARKEAAAAQRRQQRKLAPGGGRPAAGAGDGAAAAATVDSVGQTAAPRREQQPAAVAQQR
eukprot:scaffold6.g2839.t1